MFRKQYYRERLAGQRKIQNFFGTKYFYPQDTKKNEGIVLKRERFGKNGKFLKKKETFNWFLKTY